MQPFEPLAELGEAQPTDGAVAALADFVRAHPRLFVLTGAGCSTPSGIPDYRDVAGQWKRRQPVQYHDFIHRPEVRRRYWARSLVGWPRFIEARPNAAHHALAELERLGYVHQLVTQNVDQLHEQAGSREVIALHGRLGEIVCLRCGHRVGREVFQRNLAELNPRHALLAAQPLPDGDAELDEAELEDFVVPDCPVCGDTFKPDVVFFGENVPGERVEAAHAALAQAAGMLIVGSSLMVYSGFRFCHAAAKRGVPMAAVNRGRTRADELLTLKLDAEAEVLLPALVTVLS
jgi:NAD-dependent SIR2 family protein deacetylase